MKLVQKKDCFYIGLTYSLLTSTMYFQQTFYCFFTLFVTPMEYTSVVYTILSGMGCLEILSKNYCLFFIISLSFFCCEKTV